MWIILHASGLCKEGTTSMCERGVHVFLCVCVGASVSWGLHTGSQIHTGSYVFLPSERDRECYPECMLCFDWANTLCAGSCIFHTQTDTRANKHHSLLTYVAMHLVPPVSFYLKACYPSYFLFCTWPQNSSHLVCVSSIIDIRNTLVCLPEALGAFQCIFFLNKLFCFTHCGGKCLLTSFICLSWWGIVGFPLKIHCSFLRTGSNPVETSGDDSSCISDTHHMWFIILRLACPRQIGLCIFSDSPIHIHGTRLWWHIGLMKVFPVFVSQFKGVDGYLHWWRDTGSTLGQSSPPSPVPPSPPVTLLHPPS